MLISVIMHTCRGNDVPGLPEPPLDMLISSMKAQDGCGVDFEVIVVDLLYEFRKGYFDGMDLPFHIKHVPERPTPFSEGKYMRISGPKNAGVMHARGDFVVFTDDCQIWPPGTMAIYAEWARQGLGCNIWYRRQHLGEATGIDTRGEHLGVPDGKYKVVPVAHIGFIGSTATMLPIEPVLDVNGWDEIFDGTRQLEDSDFVLRLARTPLNVAYERRVQIIECEPQGGANYDKRVVDPSKQTKCNGAYAHFVWSTDRVQANTDEHLERSIHAMHWENCGRRTEYDECEPHMSECTKAEYDNELQLYRDPRLVFDLRELRDQTLSSTQR